MIKYLEQSLKLGVFVDWKLCRDVTFILPMNNQCFCACAKKATHPQKKYSKGYYSGKISI